MTTLSKSLAEQAASHSGAASGIRRLWEARDELSLLNVRRGLLPALLVFPLAVMLSDTLYRDWGTGILGMDSALFQSLFYGLAWLLAAVLPQHQVRLLPLVGAGCSALLLVPALLFAPAGSMGLLVVAAFQFAAALAAVGGFYGFCYVSNNVERWLALAAIGLYYAFSLLISPVQGSWFVLTCLLPVVLTVALVVCAARARASLGSGAPDDTQHTQPSASLARGRFSVLVLVALYYLISLADSWLESVVGFLSSAPFGFGMLLALAGAALVQLVFNRSVWHLWNLYLFLAVAGLLAAMLAGVSSVMGILGSLLNGMADNLGYLAMLYLLGGAASRDGSYRYYQVMCLFAFIFSAAVPFALEKTFALLGAAAPACAVALIFACIGGYILLSPLLQRYVFAADWIDSQGALNLQAHAPQVAEVAAIDRMEGLGLTPREREVLTLLLTDAAVKQIARELKISISTFNYHSANLYRKLEVNSRVELITRFSKSKL